MNPLFGICMEVHGIQISHVECSSVLQGVVLLLGCFVSIVAVITISVEFPFLILYGGQVLIAAL